MWSYRIVAPYQFERTSIPEKTADCLADGQVLLQFLAAGVCGSDMPAFRGVRGLLPGDHGRSGAEKDGFPIHEVAGRGDRQPAPLTPGRRPRGGLGVRLRRSDGTGCHRRQSSGVLRPDAEPRAGDRAATTGLRALRDRTVARPHRSPRRRDRARLDRVAVLVRGQSGRRQAGHRGRPGRPRRDRRAASAPTATCGPPATAGSATSIPPIGRTW